MPPNTPLNADAIEPITLLPESARKTQREQSGRLRLRINDRWYDLTEWQHKHPGGSVILQHLNNEDATDAFYSLHSEEAIKWMQKLPSSPVSKDDQPASELAVNFRKFRKELQDQGYFRRNVWMDLFYIGTIVMLFIVGTIISYEHPWIATLLIGVGMEQAGWCGHDYVHARSGKWGFWAGRLLGGIGNGFSSKWWSDKHNTHHCYPNWLGVDADIQNDPVFHLWYPAEEKDHPLRKYQHIYFIPVCAGLYASWRIQSIQHVMKTGDRLEALLIGIGYCWLFLCMPLAVSIGSIFFGGWLVGVVVTATHQSEEIFTDYKERRYDFVRDQFLSTRNATSNSVLMNWIWGGMQYQLEHHLFPFMPKYYFGKVAPLVQKFAKDNNIEYRATDVFEIWKMNLNTMKKYAESLNAPPGADIALCKSQANTNIDLKKSKKCRSKHD